MRARVLATATLSLGLTACFDDPETFETGSGSTMSSTTSPTSTSESTTESTTSSATSTSAGPTTAMTSTTSMDSFGSTFGPGTTDGTTGTAPSDCDVFDPFEDDGPLDPAWVYTARGPDVLQAIDGSVVGTYNDAIPSFHDWIVTQPDPELNVVVQVEVEVTSFSAQNEPFVVARVQPEILDGSAQFMTGYALVANTEPEPGSMNPTGGRLCVMRFSGSQGPPTNAVWCDMDNMIALGPASRSRLTLVVEGFAPPALRGVLEQVNEDGDFEFVAEVEAVDMAAGAINDPGVYGFGGGEGGPGAFIENYAFDNFCAEWL